MMEAVPERHVGAIAAMFADGALGWTYPAMDVLVTRIAGRTVPREQAQLRPASGIIGWIQWCGCGWEGRLWTRVGDPAEQDVLARRVYSPHPSPPMDVIDDDAAEEWFAHMQSSSP